MVSQSGLNGVLTDFGLDLGEVCVKKVQEHLHIILEGYLKGLRHGAESEVVIGELLDLSLCGDNMVKVMLDKDTLYLNLAHVAPLILRLHLSIFHLNLALVFIHDFSSLLLILILASLELQLLVHSHAPFHDVLLQFSLCLNDFFCETS